MPKFTVQLKKREEIAEGTMTFHFEKPAGFEFKAGQFMDVTLVNPPETDAEGNTRAYSIASAPYEPDLIIATRMRDTAFKRVLKTMPLGSTVEIDGPMGSFTLHNNAAKPAVILAGGIGVTPFRSIAFQASHDNLPQKIVLFYSNRRPEDAAYLDELMQIKNPNYAFIGTMTDMAKSSKLWTGETGYIGKEMVSKFVPDLTGPIYYTAGPPAMVAAMRTMLNGAGISDDDIRTEEFSGY